MFGYSYEVKIKHSADMVGYLSHTRHVYYVVISSICPRINI